MGLAMRDPSSTENKSTPFKNQFKLGGNGNGSSSSDSSNGPKTTLNMDTSSSNTEYMVSKK